MSSSFIPSSDPWHSRFKSFLKDLGLFLVPMVLLLGAIEWKLTGSTNSLDLKKNNFEKVKQNVRVLIIGDSHAHLGLNPVFFNDTTFNLANGGQSLYYDIELISRYFDEMPRLKYVIFAATYSNLYYLEERSQSEDRQYFYYRTFHIEPRTGSFDIRKFSYVAMYSPYQALKKSLFPAERNEEMENGYFPVYITLPPAEMEKESRRLAGYHKILISSGNLEANLRMLEPLLSKLTARGIKPVFLRYPVSPYYVRATDKGIRMRNDSVLEILGTKYHAWILDDTCWKGLGSSDFSDPVHLNFQGAQKLSKQVSEIIRSDGF